MFLVNRPGLIGVVLAVILGFQVEGLIDAKRPGLETVALNAGALFLGLYGLTLDRCEVRGFLTSYWANVQNLFAATSEAGWGTYDKAVVPGRRMAVFFLPVAATPLLMPFLGLLDVALRLNRNGALTRAERFEFVELPLAVVGIWICYAFATQSLRLRTNPSSRESVGMHF